MRVLDDALLGAFPGTGRASAEQAEIVALRKEVARLKAERDILCVQSRHLVDRIDDESIWL